MDVLSTFQRSNKDSDHSFRRNKPVHFGGSLDCLYCSQVESRLHTEIQLSSYAGNVIFW